MKPEIKKGILSTLDDVAQYNYSKSQIKQAYDEGYEEALLETKQSKKSLIIAFVQGAKWWEYEKTKFTMWQSDVLLAEKEAGRKLESGTLGKTIDEILETTKDKV